MGTLNYCSLFILSDIPIILQSICDGFGRTDGPSAAVDDEGEGGDAFGLELTNDLQELLLAGLERAYISRLMEPSMRMIARRFRKLRNSMGDVLNKLSQILYIIVSIKFMEVTAIQLVIN
jgi:hypothetical protein